MSIIKQMVIKRINSYYDRGYREVVEEAYEEVFKKKITIKGLERLSKKDLHFLEKQIELKINKLLL